MPNPDQNEMHILDRVETQPKQHIEAQQQLHFF